MTDLIRSDAQVKAIAPSHCRQVQVGEEKIEDIGYTSGEVRTLIA